MYRFVKCVNGQIFDISITEFDSLLKYCDFWSFNLHDIAFYKTIHIFLHSFLKKLKKAKKRYSNT